MLVVHPLEIVHPRSLKYLNKYLQNMVKGRLWLKILVAMVLGLGVGTFLGPSTRVIDQNTAGVIGSWLALPGQLFLGLIQMIVVPLVFASVIRGLASGDNIEQLRKTGLRLVIYFLFTTAIAITIGILVAQIVQPGSFMDQSTVNTSVNQSASVSGANESVDPVNLNRLPTLITRVLPDNPLSSMVEDEMLQVVLFSAILGIALVAMPKDQSKPLLDLLGSIQEVCMTIVRWAMLLAPVAVFGLMAQLSMKIGLEALLGMAVYVGTVLLGLLILLICYLFIIMFIAKKSPWWFLRQVRDVQLLAFSTSSSAAVMPLSIKTAEDNLKVRPSISQFIIPLGATINMDGTALYQGVATVFLAQVFGIQLTAASLLLVIVTAVGASVGSQATPGVGIVILSMVLNSVGIPAAGIALIIGVDRVLDMSRTAINVTGDLTATLVMERWAGKEQSS